MARRACGSHCPAWCQARGASLVLRVKATGPNPVYYVLGETDAGRTLFCVVIEFPGGRGYPVTAREMTTKEKRRYAEWKKR